MSYYAVSNGSDFLITNARKMELFNLICDKNKDIDIDSDLDSLFSEHGFFICMNKNGDIDELYYEYNKYYCEDIDNFFGDIAPYVERGSYITFVGEDDSVWAYYFDGQSFEEYPGEIVYPGMPISGPVRTQSTMDALDN